MPEARVLVVDDDPGAARYMTLALAERFAQVGSVAGGVEALLAMERETPHLVLADLHMPGMDGLELLACIRTRWPQVAVILVTGEQHVATVVDAVQLGASNYLVKPVSPSALCTAAARALARVARTGDACARRLVEIVGASRPMVRARHLVELAACGDVNVLLTGETGTGKDLAARAIHRLSSLSSGPFVAHNCALAPPDLFESRFFGHVRGAFTGADRDHAGLLQEADGGVLFLDELECLSPAQQATLLRVLDDGEVRPMGSTRARVVSVRFLAATNREPAGMLAAGVLREDLYYRLRGFEIRLPPLRERREDIPLLTEHFLAGMGGGVLRPEALAALETYPWPGNVRQLRNVLARARAAAGGPIHVRHLGLEPSPCRAPVSRDGSPNGGPGDAPRARTLREVERQAIREALRACRGNRSLAARRLGIDRSTLRRKLRGVRTD